MAYLSRVNGQDVWDVLQNSAAANSLFPADVDPTAGWYRNGRISSTGNNPTGRPWIIPWGQIFKVEGVEVSSDTLIKVRDCRQYIYFKTAAEWALVKRQFRNAGGQYDPTFSGGIHGGGISATEYSVAPAAMITDLVPTRFYHFFPSTQFEVPDTTDIGALITTFEAKLISKTGADVRPEVGKVIGSVGSDWRSEPGDAAPADAFIGSMKPLREYWQVFSGASVRLVELRQYGLPPDFPKTGSTDYTPGIDPDYVAA